MHVHDDAIYVHPEMMASWSDGQTKDKAYLENSENVSHVQTSLLCFFSLLQQHYNVHLHAITLSQR